MFKRPDKLADYKTNIIKANKVISDITKTIVAFLLIIN